MIFLKRLVIRNAALDYLLKIGYGRVSSGRSSGRSMDSGKRRNRLSTLGPECIFGGEVEPFGRCWRGSSLLKA